MSNVDMENPIYAILEANPMDVVPSDMPKKTAKALEFAAKRRFAFSKKIVLPCDCVKNISINGNTINLEFFEGKSPFTNERLEHAVEYLSEEKAQEVYSDFLEWIVK